MAKSLTFKNLNKEDVAKTLELADKVSKEEFERVSKMFESQDKLIAEGNVFKEMGSGMGGSTSGTMDAVTKIDAAVAAIVQKSGDKITKEQAYADFLNTSEGQALYAQHQSSRKDGI